MKFKSVLKRTKPIAASILIIALIGVIGVRAIDAKNSALTLTKSARIHLSNSFDAIDQGDFQKALEESSLANNDIGKIKLLAQSWGQDIQFLRLSNDNQSRLVAAERMLNASYLIINSITQINTELTKITNDEGLLSIDSGTGTISFDIEKSRVVLNELMSKIKTNLTKGKQELEIAKKSLPQDFNGEIEKGIKSVEIALNSLNGIEALLTDDLAWLSGTDGKDKKILLLFQNNAELRGGTGGSLGSFGVVKFSNGKLQNIDFGQNIYKLDNPFKLANSITPPEPLKWLTDNKWALKDSGWAVDGPLAFKNIEHFYKLETGEEVDGIMVIDTTAIEELLRQTGKIDLPQYNLSINDVNFRKEIEYETHKGYFDREGGKDENEPKKIISDMMPIFINKVFKNLEDKETAGNILSAFSKSLKSKHMLFYFNKTEFQNRLNELNYSGSVYPTVGDYIYINNSNIDGSKSSLSVSQAVKIKVNIQDDGSVQNVLSLKRSHNGTAEWPDGLNKNFIRLLIPEGSQIIKFAPVSGNYEQFFDKGFYENGLQYQVEKEAGKTAVNFWMTTEPGQTSELEIAYNPKIHFDMGNGFSYNLLLQKQPGANSDNVELEIQYPSKVEPQNVINYDDDNHKINLKFDLNKDKSIKINFK